MVDGFTRAYIITGPTSSRNTNDYYPTAPIATLSLVKNVDVPKRIWEPAAGRGHISKELIRNGREVVSTDLFSYPDPLVNVETEVDFLKAGRREVDGVVTNPPFKSNLAEKLVHRALDDWGYGFLALFVRLTFLESARRHKMFKSHPPSRILVLSERVQCNEKFIGENNGLGGMVAYAWFVWDNRSDLKNIVDWVRPSDYISELGD